MGLLDRPTVLKVRKALIDACLDDTVIELAETARTAEDAANSIGCELGAIVKSLVFVVGEHFVMTLVAGDRRCIESSLPSVFKLKGDVVRPKAAEVKHITGFTIGGVAPVALSQGLLSVMDTSLTRFDTVFAAAGHPHCIFSISVPDLERITGGFFSTCIAEPVFSDAGSIFSMTKRH